MIECDTKSLEIYCFFYNFCNIFGQELLVEELGWCLSIGKFMASQTLQLLTLLILQSLLVAIAVNFYAFIFICIHVFALINLTMCT